MIKSTLLALAVLARPAVNGNDAISFCEVAKPIYVQAQDYRYLQSTAHGRTLLDGIELHNQKIIDLCDGNIPRTIIR